jgi:hypothetical protein
LISGEKLNDLLAYTIEICAKLYEYLCCNAFAFTNKSKKNVFCADVIMSKLKRFTE